MAMAGIAGCIVQIAALNNSFLEDSMVDYQAYDALTFDCYGTLIDWESGILAGIRAALGADVSDATDSELLSEFSTHEHDAEVPYKGYREVLGLTLRMLAAARGITTTSEQEAQFGGSVVDWPAFPDSHDALAELQKHFKLVVITNCDDDLFAASAERLGIKFDEVITAQQVGSYKPNIENFHFAHAKVERTLGITKDRILHVAQSLFHDHGPAKSIGMTSVHIKRRGNGAAPAASATPDQDFPDMKSFTSAVTGS
jgi:2-haloacid dehalogenase